MVGKKLSRNARQALYEIEKTLQSTKRFRLKRLFPEIDVLHFYVRLKLPASEGGTQRICRQDPASLESMLKRDHLQSQEAIWFWIGQLMHYGLYDLHVKKLPSNQRLTGFTVGAIIRRCRVILEAKIEGGELTVPPKIREREEKLRALHAHPVFKGPDTDTDQAGTEYDADDDTAQQGMVNASQHGDSEEIPDNHSIPVSNTSDQFEDGDNGDTSSVDEQFPQQDVQSEDTDETDTDDESEDNEPMLDSEPDFREEGLYSIAEIQVLHDWRDRFCVRHNLTLAEFQVMMTRSNCRGNTKWTSDFITKDDFLRDFREQLPIRKQSSLWTLRRHHDWNPPNETELVRPTKKPVKAQKHRPSRLSIMEGDGDEENDAEEADILNARESIEDGDIWEIRATEPLSDNDSDDQGLHFDEHQEQHTQDSTLRRSDHCTGTSSRATPVQSQGSNAQGEQDEEEETSFDVHMTDATCDVFEAVDESSDGRQALHPETILGNSLEHSETQGEQAIDSTSGKRSPSMSVARRVTQHRARTTPSHSIDEPADVFSIPSSPPQPDLLEMVPERSSIDPPIQVPQTPTRSILRNELSPRRPRSPRPRVEELMNTHHEIPVASSKRSIHTQSLQAIKRIAGNCTILFTQLSQIEQEEELDDFVEYVSKYVKKPPGEKISSRLKNEGIGAANDVRQTIAARSPRNNRKRPRNVEHDSMETSDDGGASDLSRLEIRGYECQGHGNKCSRKTKRRKSGSVHPTDELGVSRDKHNVSVAQISTIRASSLQTPALTRVRGIQRSASHPGTPSNSKADTPRGQSTAVQPVRPEYVLRRPLGSRFDAADTLPHDEDSLHVSRRLGPMQQQIPPTHSITTSSTALTPTPRSGHVNSQTIRSTREASFEFPTPSFATSGPILQNLVKDQNCSSAVKTTRRPSTSTAVSVVDRNKPYGSQENPQIIPATPRSVRTVKLEIKGEPREESLPPDTSTRHRTDQNGSKTDDSKQSRPTIPKFITPSPVRSSSAFADPTPPSTYNHGIPRVSSLRLDQSFSQSPSFSEVMRQDDRVFRKNQPKAVNNPTRNPIIQAQMAGPRLDDHNVAAFDIENNERPDGSRIRRHQNDALSRQPQRYPSLYIQGQSGVDPWQEWTQRPSDGDTSQQNVQDTTSGNTSSYNLGIPGVWRNRMSG